VWLCALVVVLATLSAAFSTREFLSEKGGKAFYILFADQLSDPDFGSKYKDYSLFVVSPQNVTSQMLHQAKQAIPGANFVAYWFASSFFVPPLSSHTSVSVCSF
jgi:hypothetical protein